MTEVRPCVLIPTYDNPRTLEGVVRDALAQCPDVIVVDDGSGPETGEILARIEGVVVARHPQNQGKGMALRTGFEEARRLGFTHAVSMDSDGQHLADELPRFFAAIREEPEALILGNRDLVAAGAGKGSRIGRANSNFWTWVLTGVRLPDTQTGYRAYPLAPLAPLHFDCTGYDLEIEVLVKASWSGVPLRSIPIGVRYFQGDERVSHLHPFWDFLRIGRLNAIYVTQKLCLPAPYLGLRITRKFQDLPFGSRLRETLAELFVREPGSTPRIAASVGLGLFWGVAPVWGFQILLCLLTAHVLRLSKTVAVVASHISVPIMIPPILYASLVVGRLALGVPDQVPSAVSLEIAQADLPVWVVGSLLLGAGLAGVGALVTLVGVGLARRLRGAVRAEPPAA